MQTTLRSPPLNSLEVRMSWQDITDIDGCRALLVKAMLQRADGDRLHSSPLGDSLSGRMPRRLSQGHPNRFESQCAESDM